MKSDNYWRIFVESGNPEAYLEYKKLKRLESRRIEERENSFEEFASFEEFGDAQNDQRNCD